ncbi:MAG: hypothetical protein JSV79_02275 [Armatimonadota bacterium]|nr:MAG: hypothetical protein JSV79_02275 [Armatimonadota bacterium]
MSIMSAAGFAGVLSPLWRRFRPAAAVVLLVGIGAFVWGSERAVRLSYRLQAKFDHRGLWQEMTPFLRDGDAIVVANTTGILPGTWHPSLPGGYRYAPAFAGGNWHTKDVAEEPDRLASVHGRVILVGFQDYRGGHLEPPTDLPPEVALIKRVNLWAIWVKHPTRPAEQQLSELIGLGLANIQPRNGAVYPFLLRAVLLARAEDRAGAAEALEQAYGQCRSDVEREALLTAMKELLPSGVLQLATGRQDS